MKKEIEVQRLALGIALTIGELLNNNPGSKMLPDLTKILDVIMFTLDKSSGFTVPATAFIDRTSKHSDEEVATYIQYLSDTTKQSTESFTMEAKEKMLNFLKNKKITGDISADIFVQQKPKVEEPFIGGDIDPSKN